MSPTSPKNILLPPILPILHNTQSLHNNPSTHHTPSIHHSPSPHNTPFPHNTHSVHDTPSPHDSPSAHDTPPTHSQVEECQEVANAAVHNFSLDNEQLETAGEDGETAGEDFEPFEGITSTLTANYRIWASSKCHSWLSCHKLDEENNLGQSGNSNVEDDDSSDRSYSQSNPNTYCCSNFDSCCQNSNHICDRYYSVDESFIYGSDFQDIPYESLPTRYGMSGSADVNREGYFENSRSVIAARLDAHASFNAGIKLNGLHGRVVGDKFCNDSMHTALTSNVFNMFPHASSSNPPSTRKNNFHLFVDNMNGVGAVPTQISNNDLSRRRGGRSISHTSSLSSFDTVTSYTARTINRYPQYSKASDVNTFDTHTLENKSTFQNYTHDAPSAKCVFPAQSRPLSIQNKNLIPVNHRKSVKRMGTFDGFWAWLNTYTKYLYPLWLMICEIIAFMKDEYYSYRPLWLSERSLDNSEGIQGGDKICATKASVAKMGDTFRDNLKDNFRDNLTYHNCEKPNEPKDIGIPLDVLPQNHLAEVVTVPIKVEKMMYLGFCLCLDSLLYELTFMPIQTFWALVYFLKRHLISKKLTSNVIIASLQGTVELLTSFVTRVADICSYVVSSTLTKKLKPNSICHVKVRKPHLVLKSWSMEEVNICPINSKKSIPFVSVFCTSNHSPPISNISPSTSDHTSFVTPHLSVVSEITATELKDARFKYEKVDGYRDRKMYNYVDSSLHTYRMPSRAGGLREAVRDTIHIDTCMLGTERENVVDNENFEMHTTTSKAESQVPQLPTTYLHTGSPNTSRYPYIPPNDLITNPQISSVLRVALIISSFCVFSMIDVSTYYHFIRVQGLMKLYVLFNMLEIFERMWRSMGRDAFDSLMSIGIRMAAGNMNVPSRVSVPIRSGKKGFIPRLFNELRIAFLWYYNIYGSFVFHFLFTLFITTVHSVMHLTRVLLLNIAINSSDSVMFLIVVTNNFAEIKSTVFKRYTNTSLFIIVSSDIVERFQLSMDGLLVFLRLVTMTRTRQMSYVSVTSWLICVLVLEICVDCVKLCFLVKFNKIPARTFDQYRMTLVAELLSIRIPGFGLHVTKYMPVDMGKNVRKHCLKYTRVVKLLRPSPDTNGRFDIEPRGHTYVSSDSDKKQHSRSGYSRRRKNSEPKCNRRFVYQPYVEKLEALKVPFRSIYSFAHIPARRIGFFALPVTTLFISFLPRPIFSTKSILSSICVFGCLLLLKGIVSLNLIAFAKSRANCLEKHSELLPNISAI